MLTTRLAIAAAACAVTIGLVGCAAVKIQKVDPATGKVMPDAAEGLRYYLPRPYVSVFEPFIISSEVYLARGELSPDSSYVLLSEVPAGLAKLVNKELADGTQSMGDLRVDARTVSVADDTKSGRPHSTGAAPAAPAPAASAPAPAASAPAPAASAPAPAASAPEGKKPEIAAGVLNYKATNDNNAYAVTPQPRYFNILWLPDFDEQYVVSAKAGLGNAGVVLGMGQGWSLQAIDATIDNSAVVKPLLDFYSGTLGALQKLATAKIEVPLGALTGKPQSISAASFAGGTKVSVKVTKVRIVAPGLYPVLKPSELAGLKLSAAQAVRILEPVPPLTNIAFNTYDVLVIEAARPTGDSALRIQQYVDSTVSRAGTGPGAEPGQDPVEPTLLKQALGKLRTDLSSPANSTKSGEYFVPAIESPSGGVIRVTLTKRTDGVVGTLISLPDDATMKAKVIALLKASNVSVNEADITIKR